MTAIHSNSASEVNKAVEITGAAPLSKTEAKVSKTAKGFFSRIGACIAAPFKFIARIIKSGFLALINLSKIENKNSPLDKKESVNEKDKSLAEDEPQEKGVQTDGQLVQKGVQTEGQFVQKGVQTEAHVVENHLGFIEITKFVLIPLFLIWSMNKKVEQIIDDTKLNFNGYVVD